MAIPRTRPRTGRIITPYREPPDEETVRRGAIVERLQNTLQSEETLRLFPRWLTEVLAEGAWTHFAVPTTQEIYDWSDFDEFVRARRPQGLGIEGGSKQLHQECRFYSEQGDTEATAALAKLDDMLPPQPPQEIGAGKAGPGRGKKTACNTRRLYQTRADHLARLKRDRPDLAVRVISGELSANAAAIEAGFRSRTVQVTATVEGFMRAAKRSLTAPERRQLKDAL